MSGHTPGPWLTQWEHGGDESILSRDGGMHMIATCHAEDGRVIPSKANARLIAAAPELLEALIKLADAFDDLAGFEDVGNRDASFQARKAIAKATGEE